MTTRDVTSASRNLLIIYWVVSAFCSYQLGIALRVTTKLVGFATFYLGFMSLVHAPILMAAALGLCIFPKHTPHIWRKIRIPTILIWIIVTLEVWLIDDGDAAHDYPNPLTSLVNRRIGGNREVTYLLVAGVFFIIAAACYARILVIGMRTRSRTDAETQDTPPPPCTEQSSIHPKNRENSTTRRTNSQHPVMDRVVLHGSVRDHAAVWRHVGGRKNRMADAGKFHNVFYDLPPAASRLCLPRIPQ